MAQQSKASDQAIFEDFDELFELTKTRSHELRGLDTSSGISRDFPVSDNTIFYDSLSDPTIGWTEAALPTNSHYTGGNAFSNPYNQDSGLERADHDLIAPNALRDDRGGLLTSFDNNLLFDHGDYNYQDSLAIDGYNISTGEGIAQQGSHPTSPLSFNNHNSFANNVVPIQSPILEPGSSRHRALPRRRSRYALTSAGKYKFVPMQSSATRDIHPAQPSDPLERWRNSPPEDEPASMSAIGRALGDIDTTASQSNSDLHFGGRARNPRRIHRQPRRPRSAASSVDSRGSGSSQHSFASNKSAPSVPLHRRTHEIPDGSQDKTKVSNKEANKELRAFKCTFCCDDFKRKYDWARHEKSLHLDLEGWKCTPFGGSVAMQANARAVCAYCNMLDPSTEHLVTHNHRACHGDHTVPRTFKRKDHLVQHLRLVHGLESMPLIDDWKIEHPPIRSRCGFCNLAMFSWTERQDHLAFHFRKGLTMDNWHGDHDFDPIIQAQVKNAIPPYVVGTESKTLIPFSATSFSAQDHYGQVASHLKYSAPPDLDTAEETPRLPPVGSGMARLPSYIELLTSHLAKFAQEQAMNGVVPTDEMFQNESRKIMYQCEDPWNQSVADNPEWLAAFRQHHNISSPE